MKAMMMTPPHQIHQTWRRDHLRATPTDMTMLGHGDAGKKSGWRVMQCCVFAVVAITLWWTVKCLLIMTRLNMWASIPILNPWFRMVWDTASTCILYLATPLGHIARNLLFHTHYFEIFWVSVLIFICTVFPSLMAQGCASILGDPLDLTHQMLESIFMEISGSLLFAAHLYLPLPAYFAVDVWTLPTQICTDRSTYTVPHQKCSSPSNRASSNLLLFFFCLYGSIDRSIHQTKSSNPIPFNRSQSSQFAQFNPLAHNSLNRFDRFNLDKLNLYYFSFLSHFMNLFILYPSIHLSSIDQSIHLCSYLQYLCVHPSFPQQQHFTF